MRFTEKEKDIIAEALLYFRDTATHYEYDSEFFEDGCCGLDKRDQRYKLLELSLQKLQIKGRD